MKKIIPIIFLCLCLLVGSVSAAGTYAYVANNGGNTVSVINTSTNTVTATVTVGTGPVGVAINPAGTYAYVTNYGSNTVSVINTSTNTVTATVTVGTSPQGVAINPAGTYAYVANKGGTTVSVINTSTNTVTATVTVGTGPYGVAINPAGTYAYVTNYGSNTVSVINTSTNTVTATVTVGTGPIGVAINPAGTYAYVTNNGGSSVSVINTSTNTVSATVTVGSGPQGVAINPAGTYAYVANNYGTTVSVINTSTNTVTATVTVGTGPVGVAINPAGTYAYVANNGGNTVSVINTSTNTVTATVTVGTGPVGVAIASTNPPVSSFTVNQTAGTSPLTVQFNDTSVNFPTSWNWSYQGIVAGNNTQTWFSTLQNPVAVFTTGNYSINLNATNMAGFNISTQSTWINVTAPPVVSFTTNTTSGVKPLAVAFTDTSTNASSYYWIFGDGNTSTVQSPTFTYNIAGTYTVNHSASNGYTTNWSNQTNLITVLSIADPNPNSMIKYKTSQSIVNIDNQTPYVGTGVIRNISSNTTQVISNFTWNPAYVSISNIRINQSSVNITGLSIDSYAIHNDLGYAIVNESKASGFVAPANATFDFNITYVKYVAPGTSVPFSFDSSSEYYDVGNSTYWHFNTITGANAIIGVWGPIGANFSANATTVAINSPISFTDSSTGYPDAWSWTFGDGGTSTQQDPVYSYTSIGNYTVSETSYMSENATVTNTLTKTGYINVTAAPPPAPIAAFIGAPLIVSAGSVVQFTDQSLNSPTSWSWTFGDGNGNTQQNPSHVYSAIGNYTVNLTATNSQGSNTLSKTNYIQVVALAQPVASFTTNVSSGGIPLAVQFTDTSSNMPTSWAWTFGDGGVSALQNPSHTFASVGNFTVNETAYNAAGNSSAVKYIVATTLSGFTRQDLYMDPEYTLTINFVDSVTNLAIPVVKVVNAADGTSVNTTTGTYTGTFGYTTAVLYCYSDGYQAKSVSYVISSDTVETVQLTQSPTSQSKNSNVIYSPQTVRIKIVDAYGVPLPDSSIVVNYLASSLPSTDTSWLVSLFGIDATTAEEMTNGSEAMSGVTTTDGSLTFSMFPALTYGLTITNSTIGLNNYQTLSPKDVDYTIYCPLSSQQAVNNTLTQVTESKNLFYKLNATAYNLSMRYQDTSGYTTDLVFWVKDYTHGDVLVYSNDLGNPGTSVITDNYTVIVPLGQEYLWGYTKTTV